MKKICVRCGKGTNSDVEFCPYCGMRYVGEADLGEQSKRKHDSKRPLNLIIFALLIIAVVLAVVYFVGMDNSKDTSVDIEATTEITDSLTVETSTDDSKSTEVTTETVTRAALTEEKLDKRDVTESEENVGSNVIQSENSDYGTVLFFGNKISIPCKYGDLKDSFNLQEFSANQLAQGIPATDILEVWLEVPDSNQEVGLKLHNKEKYHQMNVDDLTIYGIEESLDGVQQGTKGSCEIVGGLSIGSSYEDVEAFSQKSENYSMSSVAESKYWFSFDLRISDTEVYHCQGTVDENTRLVDWLQYCFYD